MVEEHHNLHGTGSVECEVYVMRPVNQHEYWEAVTDVPCPVEGCENTVVWYEAGYVPGWRVCMKPVPGKPDTLDTNTIRHCFLARGDNVRPILVRSKVMEGDSECQKE
jgi:hypothetical protein